MQHADHINAIGSRYVEDHVPLDGVPAVALPDLVATAAAVRVLDKALHAGLELTHVLLGLRNTPGLLGVVPDLGEIPPCRRGEPQLATQDRLVAVNASKSNGSG